MNSQLQHDKGRWWISVLYLLGLIALIGLPIGLVLLPLSFPITHLHETLFRLIFAAYLLIGGWAMQFGAVPVAQALIPGERSVLQARISVVIGAFQAAAHPLLQAVITWWGLNDTLTTGQHSALLLATLLMMGALAGMILAWRWKDQLQNEKPA